MDKNLKELYYDIISDKLPEVNIPKFFNRLANDYHTFASVRLALHYYTFYESFVDEGNTWSEGPLDIVRNLNGIIQSNVLMNRNGKYREEAISRIDKIRNNIIDRIKLLTAYTDAFRIHEHVLNRVEYRFKQAPDLEDEEDFARDVLGYIFESKENATVNLRIKEIIGQLPVRMTRQKYFDILRGSIHEYIGAEENTLDTYLYMIRSFAMLEKPEDLEACYPGFKELMELLSRLDYKGITGEEFIEAECRLKEAAAALDSEISLYYGLQEITNEAYVLLLCYPYKGVEAVRAKKQADAAAAVIEGINTKFLKEEKTDPPADLLDQIALMEGLQESFGMDLKICEEVLEHLDKNSRRLTENIMADKLLNVLLLCRDLLSESIFIDFYEIKSVTPVDSNMTDAKADILIDELSESFVRFDRMVVRAVMANTLNLMPVFFENRTQVMDYILYSLKQCADPAEKAVSMELIRDMMAE